MSFLTYCQAISWKETTWLTSPVSTKLHLCPKVVTMILHFADFWTAAVEEEGRR